MIAIENSIFTETIELDAFLSFRHYIRFLNRKIVKNPINKDFYNYIIQKFESRPELLVPFKNLEPLQNENELIQLLVSTIYPLINDHSDKIFALTAPWYFKPFYFSKKFKHLFYDHVQLSDERTVVKFRREKIERLYGRILEKFYDIHTTIPEEAVYPIIDNETKLVKYYKVFFDFRFVEIQPKGDLPELDKCFMNECIHKLPEFDQLSKILPLHLFSLNGFSIINIKDVTEEAAVADLKNVLLNMLSHAKVDDFKMIEEHIKNLIGIKDVQVSLIPFPKINNKLVVSDYNINDSVLGYTTSKTDDTAHCLEDVEAHFMKDPSPIVISSIDQEAINKYPFLKPLELNNISSYVLIPYIKRNVIMGVLEIASTTENVLKHQLLSVLKPCHLLMVQALTAYLEQFDENVEHLIKEKFTSLQPAVEWKFKEVIYEYLEHAAQKKDTDVGEVIFKDVYPFFGAVDIRNSSAERYLSVQKDLLQQMEILESTLQKLIEVVPLLLVEKLKFKTIRFRKKIEKSPASEDEITVIDFLNREVNPVLNHLKGTYPAANDLVSAYQQTTTENNGYNYYYRKDYEFSLNTINNMVDKHLEQGKMKLQALYPNYFEKCKSDGVEYNIFIGQSISPKNPFDILYQNNLYLWQLKTMAEIGRMTHEIVSLLPVQLQTTQLIYVHSNPLSISFRKDERKFDVADAYNMRYEIVKKRIDKAYIKNTGERLTQPGKIAIVYNNQREAEAFEGFINFLAEDNLLHPEIEHLDLEELHGVSGLKAIRVAINMEG